jgi:hypothetical protein
MSVVEVGDFRVERARRFEVGRCQHKRLTLDDETESVCCEQCKTQVGNYAALRVLVERWALLQAKADAQRAAVAEAMSKTVVLRAAQKVEKAWRSRSMVPTCPHCREAIFPADGFGGSAISREIAERRATTRKAP